MRTIYLPELKNEIVPKKIPLTGDDVFHLRNVLRSKLGTTIQVTNGQGLSLSTILTSLDQKGAELNVESYYQHQKFRQISLLCGQPKKNAVEEIIRIAIEIGLSHIYFWKSEFAQEGNISPSRLALIVKNSMEQSNNLWVPQVHFIDSLKESSFPSIDQMLVFHNNSEERAESSDVAVLKSNHHILMTIGPEGGFSKKDLSLLFNLPFRAQFLSLKTPIMTTPTAVACALGYLLAKEE
jgi:16S rRNA (uracil1498-N3)-methyltransferase